MKRRDFSLACGAAVASAAFAQTALAQGKPLVAGTDYLLLPKPAPVDAPAGKIEVVEFFWYSCRHCRLHNPLVEAWSQRAGKDVVLRRVPVAFREYYVPQQRLYYALETMGLLEKLHTKVFDAIHVDKVKMDKASQIADWVARQGVDRAKFEEAYSSFDSGGKAIRATLLANAYEIDGIPTMGVAGRFWTDSDMAGSLERVLPVAERLVAMVRSGK